MSRREKNMECLGDRLFLLDKAAGEELPVRLEEGRFGWLTARAGTGRGWIYLHSAFDPHQEAQHFWDGRLAQIKKHAMVILVGLGLGYQARELCSQRPDLGLLAIEPHRGMLELSLENADFSFARQQRRFFVLSSNNPEEIRTFVGMMLTGLDNLGLLNGVEVFFHPVLEDYCPGWRAVAEAVRMAVSVTLVSRGTSLSFALQWHRNNLKNLPCLLKDCLVNKSGGLWAGVPAIVVGAGPSLEENMEELRQVYHKKTALILAAGTAYPLLARKGIYPHFLGTIDSTRANWEGIRVAEFAGYHDLTMLLYDSTTYPDIISDYCGDRLWAFSNVNPWKDFYAHCWQGGAGVPVVTSVSTYLVSLAVRWACRPIVLVGNDYAYGSDGRRYARDIESDITLDYEAGKTAAGEWVEDYAGGKVFSPADYSPARAYIAQLAREIQGLEIYNAALHGAAITGVPYRSMGELDRQWPSNMACIEHVKSAFKTFKPDLREIEYRIGALKKACRDFEYRIKACRKGKNKDETIMLAMDLILYRDGLIVRAALEGVLYGMSRGKVQEYLDTLEQRWNFVRLCRTALDEVKQVVDNITFDELNENA